MIMNSSTMAWLHAFILLFLLTILPLNCVFSSATRVTYNDHCGSLIPESTMKTVELPTFPFVRFYTGYYTSGIANSSLNSNSLSFRISDVFKTDKDGVFKIIGILMLQSLNTNFYVGNVSYAHPYHRPEILYRSSMNLKLRGFWSESSGELCMVGSGSTYSREGKLLYLDAVLKLYDLKNSSSVTSLVTGTLNSLSSSDNKSYFEPISVLILPLMNYEYTLVTGDGCSGGNDTVKGLPLSQRRKPFCSIFSREFNAFTLKYASDCGSTKNCSPFDGVVGYLSSVMSLSRIDCSEKEKKMRILIGFANNSNVRFYQSFNFNTSLVGEGSWDEKNNQLCIVACRFLDITESLGGAHVGDCSTRITMKFPAVWSIRDTSSVLGLIWSNKTVNESGYFKRIAFKSAENHMVWVPGVPGLRYEYTEIGRVSKSCKPAKNKGERYPNGHSKDMRFDMLVKSSKERIAWGYAVPLFVGDQFYERYLYATIPSVNETYANSVVHANWSDSSPVNISYKIGITPQPGVKLDGWLSLFKVSSNSHVRVEISAEGIYDGITGSLCMVGCRNLGLTNQTESMDCEILINYQFPPLSSKRNGGYIKGTIESTRKKSDPLYFKPLEVSSATYSTFEAKQSIWRMDLEIIMVLISNTLACVFVGLQLIHVKKHPEVVPSISLVMLLILTLGHMIPLVLNFEAIFSKSRYRQNILIHTGGWLEANEVIVRVVTMVAFLLQVCLLQLTWSSRSGDGNLKDLWFAEKSTLFLSLPLYAAGALIALLVHWRKSTHDVVMLSSRLMGYHQKSLWMDLKSYGGFVLDSFLLPQILLNIFRSSKESALSCSFYTGTTFVRLLPHAYDLYRAYSYVNHNDGSYYYAKPGADLYSTAWDVIIPLGCLVFAAIIYLQQRFGGRCIIPRKFRELEAYEKVPVVSDP